MGLELGTGRCGAAGPGHGDLDPRLGDPVRQPRWAWFNNTSPDGLISLDSETLVAGPITPIPNAGTVKGLGFDADGYLWAVAMLGAHKIEPATVSIVDTYLGLNGPYTYSDMTGSALVNTACTRAG